MDASAHWWLCTALLDRIQWSQRQMIERPATETNKQLLDFWFSEKSFKR